MRDQSAFDVRSHLCAFPTDIDPFMRMADEGGIPVVEDAAQSVGSECKGRGIGTGVYFPIPLHLQSCYALLGDKPNDFPVSEKLAVESLALPVHSELTPEESEYICDSIGAFYA